MRKAAILGLGGRGQFWLKAGLQAGWQVSGFDPDAHTFPESRYCEWQRERTISGTVKGAELIFCCVPERLELMHKVIQRAQAEAPEAAVLAVETQFEIEDVQICATRPGHLVQVSRGNDAGFALSVTSRNLPEIKGLARKMLTEFAAVQSLQPSDEDQMPAQANAGNA